MKFSVAQFTASDNFFPTLNFTTFFAGILIAFPVSDAEKYPDSNDIIFL
jgi:hypothetical protein